MKTPGSKILTVLSLAAAAFDAVIAETSIELVAPIEGSDGPQFGLIFIPGATLGGETYGPLSKAIQVHSGQPKQIKNRNTETETIHV